VSSINPTQSRRIKKFMKEKKLKIGGIYIILLLILGLVFPAHAEDTSQYVDFKTYDSKVSLEHTHIFVTEFDDNYHWERCTICDTIRNKTKHTLHGNGNSFIKCGTYYNDAYREVCSCGYETKPFYVIHGRWENYSSCKTLNYTNNPGSLSNVMQITKAKFNSEFSGKTHDGQEYTWHDDDGDGKGWVFCGGPIIGDSNGVKSSLALILGYTGGFGRNYELDEFYTLGRYISENNNITRSQFVSKLKSKSQLTSNHCLYGMKEKYNGITDAQWNKIRALFKGYTVKKAEYTWNVMFVRHSGHQSSGNALYRHESCFDSNLGRRHSFEDGIPSTCDVCEASFTGNEYYTDLGIFGTPKLYNLKEGETIKSSTYSIYGVGKTKLAEVYCVYSRRNNKYYQDKMIINASPGVTVTNNNPNNILLKTTSNNNKADWGSVKVQFTYKYKGTTYTKDNQFRYYYAFVDNTAPVIKSIDQKTQTEKNGWATIKQITINGTEDICSQVKLKLFDVISGKQIGSTYTVDVNNKTYKFSFTPPIEGPSSGRRYKIQVTDNYYNTSEKEFIVYKTDGSAPAIQSSSSYLDWTGVKTITLKYTDYGTGADNAAKGVWVSFGDQNNFQRITDNGGGNYSVTYKFGKEITGGVKYRVYAKDTLGNITVNTITVGNIDRTAPVINDATVKYGSKSAVVNATDERSGIVGYGISADATTVPKTWQTGNTLSQNEYGDYYVFVKDKAGNISAYKKVTLGIFEIYYKLDGGTNDGGNPSTYTINDRVIFKDPSKRGYDFLGWYTDSDFTNEIKSIEKGSTENKTLYAKWEPITYYIMYNFYGGKPAAYDYPKTYTIETPSFTLENPTYEGKIFMGWSDWNNAQRKTTYTVPKGSIGDLVISANWDVNTDFHGNGNNGDGGNGTGNKEITGSSNITSNKFILS